MSGPAPERRPDLGLLQDANVAAMLAWRSDSIMLRLLWDVFADLMDDAARAQCVEPEDRCAVRWPGERHRWCEGCGLVDIALRVQLVARPPATLPVVEHATPDATGEPSATD